MSGLPAWRVRGSQPTSSTKALEIVAFSVDSVYVDYQG